MVAVTIKSNPAGFITELGTYQGDKSHRDHHSLNGATNGSHFAYWTDQRGAPGIAQRGVESKVCYRCTQIQIVAHYIPSTEDTDGDGVMDWFELTSLATSTLAATMIRMGMGFPTSGRANLGRRQPFAECTEWGGLPAGCPTVCTLLSATKPPAQ